MIRLLKKEDSLLYEVNNKIKSFVVRIEDYYLARP